MTEQEHRIAEDLVGAFARLIQNTIDTTESWGELLETACGVAYDRLKEEHPEVERRPGQGNARASFFVDMPVGAPGCIERGEARDLRARRRWTPRIRRPPPGRVPQCVP
jgi:hypothetical protein